MLIRRKTHAQRLKLAEEIRDEIKAVLGNDLRAFVVCGSVGRNDDGPYSDLEVTAITSDVYNEDSCSLFNEGIMCDIHYIPLSTALSHAGKMHLLWPLTASWWNLFLPLYVREDDDCLERIKNAARNAIRKRRAYAKARASAVLEMLELVSMLKDARHFNVKSAVTDCLFRISRRALWITGFVNRYYYHSQRNAWEESKALGKLPRGYARLSGIVNGETGASLADRCDSAFKMWRNFQRWLYELGIDWQEQFRMRFPERLPEENARIFPDSKKPDMRILKKTHAQRMKLAEKLCTEIKTALGEGLRAVCVYGPVAAEEDGPYGDLDLMAITTDDIGGTDSEFCRDGIKVGIEFIPYLTAVKRAGAVHIIWPLSAYQWHLFKPLYVKEGDDCLERIRSTAGDSLKKDEKFTFRFGGRVMGVYEIYSKLMNTWEMRIRSDVQTNLREFCFYLLLLVSFVNRYFYRNCLYAYEESKQLANLPAGYARLTGIVLGETETSIDSRYDAALELWKNTEKWAAGLGIKWQKRGKLKFPKRVKE